MEAHVKKIIVALPLLVTVFFVAGCGPSLPEGIEGEIAYVSSVDNDGAHDIFILKLPSLDTVRVTNTSGTGVENLWLDWSVYGKLAYASTRDAARDYEIFIYDPETGKETRMTNNDYFDGYPTFSPEEKMLAFSSAPPVKKGMPKKDIYIMDLATKKVEQLTDTQDDEITLSWSPDGSMIAFSRYVTGRAKLFIIDLASGRELQLTDGMSDDLNPTWTKDGKFIIFSSNRGDTVNAGGDRKFGIYTIELANPQEVIPILVGDNFSAGNPSVSNDGKWLVYQYMENDWNWMYIKLRPFVGNEEKVKDYVLVKNIFYNRNPVWK
jgi:Tol biopolymer transport system component